MRGHTLLLGYNNEIASRELSLWEFLAGEGGRRLGQCLFLEDMGLHGAVVRVLD